MKILYVEDDVKINTLVEDALRKNKFIVDSSFNITQAMDNFHKNQYDIIILDLMLGNESGVDLMLKIRETDKNIPIIALTALSSTDDIVTGLNKGFDDYLAKPFKVAELIARINSLIRRNSNLKNQSYKDIIYLDSQNSRILIDGKELDITQKEYMILEYLIINEGIYQSSDKIVAHVWGYDSEIESNSLAVHIRNLKVKMENFHKGISNVISSSRGKGYKYKKYVG